VTGELARVPGVDSSTLIHYEPDGNRIVLAAHREPGLKEMPVRERDTSADKRTSTSEICPGDRAPAVA
jgi:hypothetical protein